MDIKRGVMPKVAPYPVDVSSPDLSGYQNGADIPAPHLPLATLFARKGPTTMDTPFVGRGAINPPLFIAGDYDGNVAFVKSSHFYLRRKRGPGRGSVTHRVVHPPFFTIDSFSDIHI